jgi:hypothetical protein
MVQRKTECEDDVQTILFRNRFNINAPGVPDGTLCMYKPGRTLCDRSNHRIVETKINADGPFTGYDGSSAYYYHVLQECR